MLLKPRFPATPKKASKANCQPGYFCVDGNTTVAGCAVAFFAHIILHTLALKFVVPIFGLQGTGRSLGQSLFKNYLLVIVIVRT